MMETLASAFESYLALLVSGRRMRRQTGNYLNKPKSLITHVFKEFQLQLITSTKGVKLCYVRCKVECISFVKGFYNF